MAEWQLLYLDDEPLQINALRRLLRAQAPNWQGSWCQQLEQGAQALQQSCQLLLVDSRMPSAQALLEQARALQPECVRVVLWGELDDIERLLDLEAQLWLPKPFDQPLLQALLERVERIWSLPLTQPQRRALGAVRQLPAEPRCYQQLQRLLRDENAQQLPMDQVAELIEQDMGLSTRMLQLANAPLFGFARTFYRVSEAVVALGLERVRALVLAAELYCQGDIGPFLLQHGLGVAERMRSEALARGLSIAEADRLFLLGILHDLGRLLERLLPDLDHSVVGSFLLELWGFDPKLAAAVLWHHHPERAPEPDQGLALLWACERLSENKPLDDAPAAIASWLGGEEGLAALQRDAGEH